MLRLQKISIWDKYVIEKRQLAVFLGSNMKRNYQSISALTLSLLSDQVYIWNLKIDSYFFLLRSMT